MKREVIYGLINFTLIGAVALISQNIKWLVNISSVIGFILIGFAIISSGALGSSYQVRAVHYSESREARLERHEREKYLLIIGGINIIGALIVYQLLW